MTLDDRKMYENDDPEEEQEEEEEEEEEDLVDPMDEIKAKCGESSPCTPSKSEWEVCEERVNGRSQTEEDCTQEMFEFLHCVDNCMVKELFNHVK